MPFKKRILTIGLLVAAITLHAQPLFSDIAVTAITPAQGLSQASNYFRHEDGLGFMWLTGNNALNRYDGSAIKVYNLRKYFIDCDVLKQGYGFAEDADHNVYVGSIAGLYIYHRSKDRFTLQKIFMAGMDSSAMPFAFKDDKIWCFNRNYQLATYHVRTKAVEQVGQLPLPPISSLHIYGISFSPFYYRMPLMDEQGTIWATGTEKVVAFDTRTGRTTEPFAAFLRSQNISITCCCYRKGLLTCGTTHGLLLLNLPQGKAQHIKTIARQPLGFINGIGCTDSLIALRWNYSQLALVSINEMRIQLVTQLTDVQLNKLFNLSFDRSGRLWACNDGIELLVLDFSGRLLHKEPGSRLPVSHPLNKGCHTFAELPNGHVVIKCEYLFDRQQNQFVRLPFILPDDAATKRACTDFFRKGVWFFYDQPWDEIVTPSRAMYFYGAQGLRTIAIKPHANNPIKQQQDMVALPNGRLLCSFGEGLFWWLPDSQQLRKASGATAPNAFKINPLSNNRVAVSYLDDNMYVYRVMPNNDLQLLQTVMPGVVTFYLQQDSMHQRYWAGTDRGVFLLNEQLQPLQHFEAGNGLAGTKIYGLLLDNDGNVYCSHERGLSYINARTLQIINLGMEDGIQDFDFHNRSFLKTADGTLFFGGTRGFNWFKPPFRFQSFYQPEVYVDELLVNNRPYRNDTNAHYLQALYLDDANNDISIRAVVKDLAYSSGYRLVYRFAGQDTTWKEVPFNGPLNFNRLAPGSYTLQLGIYNKYTAGYRLQKSIHIVIEAPFYRRAWFWALMAIAGTASALWWVYRRKLARQKERFLQQLALEKQRLRITADLHDEIGASLSSLQINSAVAGQLLGKDNEGAQKVLHKIESQAHKLATAIGDIIWSMKPGKEEFMTLSTKIKQFAGEMLEPSNIQFSIDIPTEIDKGLTDIALRKNLLLILKEAINNAAKYSRASQLQIGLHLQNGQIALRVADNGIGFDPQGVKGNGLGNMRHRATELGGTLSVQSAPGKGTVIMAQMPAVP